MSTLCSVDAVPPTGPNVPFPEEPGVGTLWLSSFRGRAVRPNVPRLVMSPGRFVLPGSISGLAN